VRIALAGIVVILAALAMYWFVLRTTYVPVLTSLPPEDAVDVVKVLDAKKIAYRLADAGTTILVPTDQADKARIELVGSELPMRGQVGFELFNQSDMGLTEFAQKINYQRALQGELARTLLMLDGIQSVRVHLGLAERSLFRDEQSRPKASVALVLKPGNALTESRVSGIQRLVAGAIPDLTPEAVAVLDETGKVVSREDAVAALPMTASEARLQLYRANILSALRQAHPDRQFGVTVSLQVPAGVERGRANAEDASAGSQQPAIAGDAVRVMITTSALLEDSMQQDVARAVRANIGPGAQQTAVTFIVGNPALLSPTLEPVAISSGRSDQVVAKSTRGATGTVPDNTWSLWLLLVPFAIIAIAAAIWNDNRRRKQDRAGLVSFTEQLRERLAAMPEATA
jgi:flagellar M-ring protein FliF